MLGLASWVLGPSWLGYPLTRSYIPVRACSTVSKNLLVDLTKNLSQNLLLTSMYVMSVKFVRPQIRAETSDAFYVRSLPGIQWGKSPYREGAEGEGSRVFRHSFGDK